MNASMHYWLSIISQKIFIFLRQFFRKTTQTSICIKAGHNIFCDQIKNRIFLVMWRKNIFQLGDNIDLNSSVFQMRSDVILGGIRFSAATKSI